MTKALRFSPIALLLLISAFIAYFISISEGFHGGGDSLAHYRIAKFSWDHPMYLLDHWGKPFFTLLALPSVLFGFKGIQFFNLLCGALSALLVLGIAREQGWKHGWSAIAVIMLTPIFMEEFFSGLTEAAFAMLFLSVIYLRLKKHHVASLILLSFLPLVRTEAILFLVWAGIFDLFERRSWQTVLLLTGTVVYSLIGWVAKDDLFWLINEMPYSGGDHIYGSGPLFHYFKIMPETIGWPVLIASLVGVVFILLRSIQKDTKARWVLIHVLVPVVLYVAFHSIIWYIGQVSLGLYRMLAVIVPMLAVVVVFALNEIGRSTKSEWIARSSAFLLFGLVIWNAYSWVKLPVKLGPEEVVLNEVAAYIKKNKLTDHKIHYYSLYNEITLGLNPNNEAQCQQVIHKRSKPHEGVAAGSLVIWDAHYAPNEGAMPLENLLTSEYFELLKIFRPERSFNTLGDRPFEVYLFLRK